MAGVTRLFLRPPCRLCLVFLASGCIMYAMPVVRCAAFCLLLPFLILPTLASPQEQAREANPDYSFNALPTYNFKLKENGTGESGVLAAGTDKERAISGEDAVSSIPSSAEFWSHGLQSSCMWWKNAATNLNIWLKKQKKGEIEVLRFKWLICELGWNSEVFVSSVGFLSTDIFPHFHFV